MISMILHLYFTALSNIKLQSVICQGREEGGKVWGRYQGSGKRLQILFKNDGIGERFLEQQDINERN
jgi:hypothetical protein